MASQNQTIVGMSIMCEEFSFKAKVCDHFAGFVVTASPLACKILKGLGLVFLAIF